MHAKAKGQRPWRDTGEAEAGSMGARSVAEGGREWGTARGGGWAGWQGRGQGEDVVKQSRVGRGWQGREGTIRGRGGAVATTRETDRQTEGLRRGKRSGLERLSRAHERAGEGARGEHAT